jgi:hypothetical protein
MLATLQHVAWAESMGERSLCGVIHSHGMLTSTCAASDRTFTCAAQRDMGHHASACPYQSSMTSTVCHPLFQWDPHLIPLTLAASHMRAGAF